MQRALNALSQWCKTWRMRVNVSKTSALSFGDHSSSTRPELKIDNETIRFESSFKYLGMLLQADGHWNLMTDKVREKATSQLEKLRAKFYMNGLESLRMRELLFRIINRPVYQFGMEIWDPDAMGLHQLESLSYQAGKAIIDPRLRVTGKDGEEYASLRLHPHLSKAVIRGELNWESVSTELTRAKLRFLGKLMVTGKVKETLGAPLCSGGHRRRQIWMEKMMSLVSSLSLKPELNELTRVGPKGLLSWQNSCEKVLNANDLTDWNTSLLHHGEELHLYSQIKNSPGQEAYLFECSDRKMREAALVQINMRGGWTSADDIQHPEVCRLCHDSGHAETSEHLLLSCAATKVLHTGFRNIQNVLSEGDLLSEKDSTPSGKKSSQLVDEWKSLSPTGQVAVLLGFRRPSWEGLQDLTSKIDRIGKDVCLAIWNRVHATRNSRLLCPTVRDAASVRDEPTCDELPTMAHTHDSLLGRLRPGVNARRMAIE
jgi:hypothetical protein